MNETWAVPIIVAFLSAGGVKFLYDAYRERRMKRENRPTLAEMNQRTIDANILTVAKARDELEADNTALRETLAAERAQHAREREAWRCEREQHARERQAWQQEREAYQAEIDRLLERVRTERKAAAARYDALLAELHELKIRHAGGAR